MFDLENQKNSHARDQLRAIGKRMRSALTDPNAEHVISDFIAAIGEALDCGCIYVFEKNSRGTFDLMDSWVPEGKVLPFETTTNISPDVVEPWYRVHHVLDAYPVAVMPDVNMLRERDPKLYEAFSSRGIRSLYTGLLNTNIENVGFFGIDNPPLEDMTTLAAFFRLIGMYLSERMRNHTVITHLKGFGYVDKLTGIGNINSLCDHAESIDRNDSVGALYGEIVGIDTAGEREGHAAIDRMIRATALTLSGVFRAINVYRVGDNAFFAVVTNIDKTLFEREAKQAMKLLNAERIPCIISSKWWSESIGGLDMMMHYVKMLNQIEQQKWSAGKALPDSETFLRIVEINPKADTYRVIYDYFHPMAVSPLQKGYENYKNQKLLRIAEEDRERYATYWELTYRAARAETNRDYHTEIYYHAILGTGSILVKEITSKLSDETVLVTIRNAFLSEEAIYQSSTLYRRFGEGESAYLDMPLSRDDAFYDQADRWLASADIKKVAVLATDINRFKLYNDIFGRKAGDDYLELIGNVLKQLAEDYHGVAGYLGGDDFCMMMPVLEKDGAFFIEQAEDYIKKVTVSEAFSPTVGIYICDNIGKSAAELYDRAQMALSVIRGSYTQKVRLFDENRYKKLRLEQLLLMDVQNGLQTGEFTFYLQPKVDAFNGKIVSAEALVRWIHHGELVSPGAFIPTLENTGFIYRLDRYIWEEICKWQRATLDAGKPALPVSVNVSRVDFDYLDVDACFEALIAKYDLPAHLIEIEITESAYAEATSKLHQSVARLRKMGFAILMDDFGKGYSSLNMLQNLNVDVLKIDKRFLDEGKDAAHGSDIIKSIIDMAHMLNLPVVAEGVEDIEQLEELRGFFCDFIQGYYFYKPMPIDEYEKLLSDPDKVDNKTDSHKGLRRPKEGTSEVYHSSAKYALGIPMPYVLFNVILNDDGEVEDVLFTACNHMYEEFIGYSFEKVEGKSFLNAVKDSNVNWKTIFYQVAYEGKHHQSVYYSDTAQKWLYFSAFQNGEKGYAAIVYADISMATKYGEFVAKEPVKEV